MGCSISEHAPITTEGCPVAGSLLFLDVPITEVTECRTVPISCGGRRARLRSIKVVKGVRDGAKSRVSVLGGLGRLRRLPWPSSLKIDGGSQWALSVCQYRTWRTGEVLTQTWDWQPPYEHGWNQPYLETVRNREHSNQCDMRII